MRDQRRKSHITQALGWGARVDQIFNDRHLKSKQTSKDINQNLKAWTLMCQSINYRNLKSSWGIYNFPRLRKCLMAINIFKNLIFTWDITQLWKVDGTRMCSKRLFLLAFCYFCLKKHKKPMMFLTHDARLYCNLHTKMKMERVERFNTTPCSTHGIA